MDKELKKYLEEHDISYIEHKHEAVFTVFQSREIDRNIPGLHCKTLFLKNHERFYLIGMPAEKRLNIKRLEKHLGVRKVRFGSVEELKEEVNLTPGSVSIFGAIYIKDKTRLIIDKEVWKASITGFHPNINTSTLEITHDNLEKFYNSLNCEKEILDI